MNQKVKSTVEALKEWSSEMDNRNSTVLVARVWFSYKAQNTNRE